MSFGPLAHGGRQRLYTTRRTTAVLRGAQNFGATQIVGVPEKGGYHLPNAASLQVLMASMLTKMGRGLRVRKEMQK